MQQALNLNGSNAEFAMGASTSPMTDAQFTEFRDGVGTLIKMEECKQRIFQGGLEPSLRYVYPLFIKFYFGRSNSINMADFLKRRVVWKHLLNVYPDGLNGSERMKYMVRKSDEYHRLKSEWMFYYRNKKVDLNICNHIFKF